MSYQTYLIMISTILLVGILLSLIVLVILSFRRKKMYTDDLNKLLGDVDWNKQIPDTLPPGLRQHVLNVVDAASSQVRAIHEAAFAAACNHITAISKDVGVPPPSPGKPSDPSLLATEQSKISASEAPVAPQAESGSTPASAEQQNTVSTIHEGTDGGQEITANTEVPTQETSAPSPETSTVHSLDAARAEGSPGFFTFRRKPLLDVWKEGLPKNRKTG